MANERIQLLIIGSGPAGYTAAIYACRANLKAVVYEGIQPGGQLTTTTEIENFPGYPNGVQGQQMMDDFKAQAERFGAEVRFGIVTKADFSQRPFKAQIDDDKWVEADAVIIATGATARYLGLESEEKFRGQGVSACATCDGFFYRGKDVAVVGGGDTACEEATYLASLCRKVYMIVRRNVFRASKAMQERVFNTPNIEVLWEHQTKEIIGNDMGVTGAVLRRNDGTETTISIDGLSPSTASSWPSDTIPTPMCSRSGLIPMRKVTSSPTARAPVLPAPAYSRPETYRTRPTVRPSTPPPQDAAPPWMPRNI